jgi:hypothetical protein
MTRTKFKETIFRIDSLERIEQCNDIIGNYQDQGLRLTLRQLYYQLVTRNIIKNEEKSYKALSGLVSNARLAGLVDWDAIEDRVRRPQVPQEFENLSNLVDVAITAYRLPRWEGQRYYVELWVEKDALAGVLAPIASSHHVTLMVNRGYSSQSCMYECARRYLGNIRSTSKQPILLYLGDHDPSGEDMVRDITERLDMFGVRGLIVEKLALTFEQVKKYSLPPNPAKMSDPRAKEYIEKHGSQSWEVDALPPEVLGELINDAITSYVDLELMEKIKVKENEDKERLQQAAIE